MLYEREGLAVRKIEFVDNQDCIGKKYKLIKIIYYYSL